MDDPRVERYLRLGLRVGRHVDGIVDAYFGPPELAAEVDAAAAVDPRRLVADAEALLDELPDGWLRDQVAGLRVYAGVLAGEGTPYADEVERCFGVRPSHTDEAVFEAAHAQLEGLLPGDGTLAERYRGWRDSILVPAGRIEPAVAAVIDAARAWTRGLVELPEGEGMTLHMVQDKPWMAFNLYLGDLQSRVEVNTSLPISAAGLLRLAIHEAYPGHHVERACKEERLVRGRGLVEETLVLVPAPQSLVSEGIAELATWLVLDGDGGAAHAALERAAGVELDLAHALAVERVTEPLGWANVNAALMLHEGGASAPEVRAYLERWALMPPEMSAHIARFMTEPTSRTYIITYAAGLELCRAYVAGDPARFRHLLNEQVRVGELLAARGNAPLAPA